MIHLVAPIGSVLESLLQFYAVGLALCVKGCNNKIGQYTGILGILQARRKQILLVRPFHNNNVA